MSSKALPKELSEDQIKLWMSSSHLGREKLLEFYKEFHEFSTKNDNLDEENFVKFFERLNHTSKESDSYYRLVFKAFDHNNNGKVDFHEFLIAFNALGQGEIKEKLSFIFDLYDQNHDSQIDITEMKLVLKAILKVCKKNLVGNQTTDSKIDELFEKLDQNENGKISREEFIESCSDNIFLRESLEPKL